MVRPTTSPDHDAGSLRLEEAECLLNEGGVVLEDAAVPGIRKNAQLRIRQPAGEFERVRRRHHHVVIAIGDQDGMLDLPKRRGVTLPPGLDRRNLRLNGFVAYGRVEVLGAFFQAPLEVAG